MKRHISIGIAALSIPGIALASTPTTFAGLANQIVQILSSATVDLIVLAIVVYFWGVSSSLFSQGEKGHERLREQLLWGIVVIFFAVSIWGIVNLVQSSIFGSSTGSLNSSSSLQTCSGLSCQFGQ